MSELDKLIARYDIDVSEYKYAQDVIAEYTALRSAASEADALRDERDELKVQLASYEMNAAEAERFAPELKRQIDEIVTERDALRAERDKLELSAENGTAIMRENAVLRATVAEQARKIEAAQ